MGAIHASLNSNALKTPCHALSASKTCGRVVDDDEDDDASRRVTLCGMRPAVA